MNNVEAFKVFVRNNQHLVTYVRNNEMTWQQIYELWQLYGEDHSIWNQYKQEDNKTNDESVIDLVGMLKKINIDDVKNTIKNISNVISMFQDLMSKNETPKNIKEPYQPRAIYRKFED